MSGLKFRILLTIIVIVLAAQTPCHAQVRSQAVATVRFTVEPSIFVSPTDTVKTQVDEDSNQPGEISIGTVFYIKANFTRVGTYVTATDLYKDGLVDGNVKPIPLKLSGGSNIEPFSAHVVGGQGNTVSFDEETTLEGFPARSSNSLEFESDQPGRFVQDVLVTLTWEQNDPRKPPGKYIGKVKLVAFFIPD